MNSCSVEDQVNLVKALWEDYSTLRHPLAGKKKLKNADKEALLGYLKTKAEAQETYLNEIAKLGLSTKFADGVMAKEFHKIDNALKVPYKDLATVRPTTLNSVEFTFDPQEEGDKYLLKGKVEKDVRSLQGVVRSVLAANHGGGLGAIVDNEDGTLMVSGLEAIAKHMPVMALLFDKVSNNKYEWNLNALVAISAGAQKEIAEALSTIASPHDEEMIGEIVGLHESLLTSYAKSKFDMGGLSLGLFAETVGSSVLRELGISINKDIVQADMLRLKSSIGLLASELAVKNGLIEPMTVDMTEFAKSLLNGVDDDKRVELVVNKLKSSTGNAILNGKANLDVAGIGMTGDEVKTRMTEFAIEYAKGLTFPDMYGSAPSEEYRAAYSYVIGKDPKTLVEKVEEGLAGYEDLTDIEDKVKKPTFVKPKGPRTVTKSRDRMSVATEQQEEYINTAESIPYLFNSGMDLIEEELQKILDTEQLKVLRDALGYPDTETNVSKGFAVGTESRQNRIDKVIADVRGFYAEAKKEEGPFYLKWFLPANNRVMVSSNTINPQNDKELVRWLLSQEGVDYSISRAELEALLKKDSISVDEMKALSKNLQTLMLGSVQAFGGKLGENSLADIDKGVLEDVFKSFKLIMNSDTDTLLGAMWKGKGHLGQKATVVALHKAYLNEDVVLTSHVMFEADGLTNALFYKMLQTPMNVGDGFLEKVGVIDLKDAGDAEHMGDIKKANPDSLDTYLTIGGTFRGNLRELLSRETPENPALVAAAKGLIEEKLFVVDQMEGELTKKLRDFVKPGTMIVNYGAGIRKIVEQAVNDYINGSMGNKGLLDKILELEDKKVSELFGIPEKEVEQFKSQIKTLDPLYLKNTKGYKKVAKVAEFMIGGNVIRKNSDNKDYETLEGPFVDALEEHFAPYIEASNLLITLQNAMHSVLQGKIRNWLKEKYPGKQLTDLMGVEKEEMYIALGEYVPSLARPDTSVVSHHTSVMGKRTSALEGDKSANLVRKGASTITGSTAKRQNPSYNNVTSLYGSLLVEGNDKPGAKGLPFDTHTQDALHVTDSVLDMYEKVGAFVLQVFDADVISGAAIGIGAVHNEVAMLGNLRYNAYEDNVMRFQKVKADLMEYVRKDPRGRKAIGDALQRMEDFLSMVQSGRQMVFSRDKAVFQMSGMVGSRYDYVVDEVKAAEKKRLTDAVKWLKDNKDLWQDEPYAKQVESIVNGPESSYTQMVFDASWNGLEDGEVAKQLQVIREADTAVRTIRGEGLWVGMERDAKGPTPEDLTGLVALVSDLSNDVKANVITKLKGLLGKSTGDIDTFVQELIKGCE